MSANHRKTATTVETCMRGEQHVVICFFVSEGEKPADIHCRINMQYGGNMCVLLWQVYEWYKKFESGVSDLAHAACSGWPHCEYA